jgi:hypothetical protein
MNPGSAEIQSGIGLAAAAIVPVAASSLVDELRLMVSCGSHQDDLRNVAEAAIQRLAHMIRFDLGIPYNVIYWDYRLDESRDEEAGDMPNRSLDAVRRSIGVIGVLGHLVPPTTRLEIRHHYELASAGQTRKLWVYADNRQPPSDSNPDGLSTRHEFLSEIKRDFGKERWCPPITSKLDFQAAVLTQVTPHILKLVGPAYGPVISSTE